MDAKSKLPHPHLNQFIFAVGRKEEMRGYNFGRKDDGKEEAMLANNNNIGSE